MKKGFIFICLIILISSMVGCVTEEETAKQSLLNSIEENKKIENMTYSGNIEVVNDFNDDLVNSENKQLMQVLNNYNITFDGKLKQEPFYMEMDMSILTNIQGMELVFDIPMIAKDNNLYIKIPSMLLMYMPEVEQNYLMMDISKRNQAEYKENSFQVFTKIVDAIDEKDFLRNDTKSYSIDNGKVGEVITLNITQESLKSYLERLVNNEGLSEIIIYLDKYSISDDLKVKLQQIKSDLDNDIKSIDQIASDLNNKILINNCEVTTVYDKDGLLRKIIFNIDIYKYEEEIKSLITGQIDINTINKGIQIEKQIPSQDEVINIDNLNLSKFTNE